MLYFYHFTIPYRNALIDMTVSIERIYNPFISTTTEFEKTKNKNELIRRGLAFFRVAYSTGVWLTFTIWCVKVSAYSLWPLSTHMEQTQWKFHSTCLGHRIILLFKWAALVGCLLRNILHDYLYMYCMFIIIFYLILSIIFVFIQINLP